MKKIKFLSLLISCLFYFSSCQMEELGGDIKFLEFSPEVATSGFYGENQLFSTDTLLVKVHLNNVVFKTGIDYEISYLPKSGEGKLLFENTELIAKKAHPYNSTIDDDVLSFQYIPHKASEVEFDILISAEGVKEELLSFSFNVLDPMFKINFLNVPDSLDINRTYAIGLKVESYAPGEGDTKAIGVSAKFAENTRGTVLFSQGNKDINLINDQAQIDSTINTFNYTPSEEGLSQIIFNFSEGGISQEAVLNINVYKPAFSVRAYASTEGIAVSGDFKATVVIDPRSHPDNKVFDLYSTIYKQEAVTKSGETTETLVSRTLLKEDVKADMKRSSASGGAIVEEVTLSVDLTGLLVCKVEAISKVYGNGDDAEVNFVSSESTFNIVTEPKYNAPIEAIYNSPQLIEFTTLQAANAEFYKLRYKVLAGTGTLRDSHGFEVAAGKEFIFSGGNIEFTPTELGDVILELEATAHSNSSIIERKTLTYVFRTDYNSLVADIEKSTGKYSVGVPIEFKVTLSKEGFTGRDFSTIYSLAEGAGKLQMLDQEIRQNTSFSLLQNIQQSFSYTPSKLGEHEVVFNIEIENNRYVKKSIFFDVKVNIGTSVDPVIAATISDANSYEVNTPYEIVVSNVQSGYTFLGIFAGGHKVTDQLTYKASATADVHYIAKFNRNSYSTNITIEPAEGGSVSGGGSFFHNDPIRLVATAKEGYIFSGLSCDDGSLDVNNSVISGNVTQPINVTANFTKKTYTINFTAGTGGTVSNAGRVFEHGESARSTAIPASGYKFIGWYQSVEKVCATEAVNINVFASGNYEARFEENTADINVFSSNLAQGTVSGGGTKTVGSSVTVTAIPIVSHNFEGWYDGTGDKVSSSASYTFTVTNNITLTARFAIKTFIVTVPSNTNIFTINGAGTYNYGSRVTGTITILTSGYGVKSCTVPGGSFSNNTFTIPAITSNTTIGVTTENNNRYISYSDHRIALNELVPAINSYTIVVSIKTTIRIPSGPAAGQNRVTYSNKDTDISKKAALSTNTPNLRREFERIISFPKRVGKYHFHKAN